MTEVIHNRRQLIHTGFLICIRRHKFFQVKILFGVMYWRVIFGWRRGSRCAAVQLQYNGVRGTLQQPGSSDRVQVARCAHKLLSVCSKMSPQAFRQ